MVMGFYWLRTAEEEKKTNIWINAAREAMRLIEKRMYEILR